MSHIFHHTEGIILRVIPFRDYDSILIVFTPDAGIIKILYKGTRGKQRSAQGMCIPLTQVEVIYREKRGEIFSCHEMALSDSFFSLRKELIYLEVACDLLQVILASQLVGKAAPPLYALLCFYLTRISQTLHPWMLAASFRLKLLKYEGLVNFPFICSHCQQSLHTVAYTHGSEGWCKHHQPIGSQMWEQDELEQVYRLATCQNYQEINKIDIALDLQNKIKQFFEMSVKGNFV